MTTTQHFLLKLFEKNDNAKQYYKNLSFNQFSNEEKQFLSHLSIMSKYKDYIKMFVGKIRVKYDEKRNYILSYKSMLSYEDYITYDSSVDMLEQKKIDSIYIFGIGGKLIFNKSIFFRIDDLYVF